jgi:hypothetical protein
VDAANSVVISAAVEGLVDEVILRRLVRDAGVSLSAVYGKNGKDHLRKSLPGYNRAARFSAWLVLVDLNSDAECAPPFIASWLQDPAPQMCFRVAVRAIESWLLADRERLGQFLGLATSLIPGDPEALLHPKRVMVDLARKSRRRDVREDMVPRPGSGRSVGPAYSSRLIEFAETHWRPPAAARHADSLRRFLTRLTDLAKAT